MRAGYPSWSELCSPFLGELNLSDVTDLPQLVQYFQKCIHEPRAGQIANTMATSPVAMPMLDSLRPSRVQVRLSTRCSSSESQ